MKTIKILGTGCPKCKQTTKNVEEAVSQSKGQFKIEKVEDIMDIMEYNIMTTPAVVVDEIIMVKGRIPSVSEIYEFIDGDNVNSTDNHKNDDNGCCGGSNCC